ncbi:ABC-type glycerol-3-phosphate transport system permease component [Deinobacterium chartae]|uniref:ABC-type glycerol-3-phosphate transport system permease component n=1 Tax=Deinobacterium chartae TaxID=521158 RepID=A0A841HX06_9DEIO|nr:ABC-type glycerol-3-phosphate transport system permease component [Deinobacterium chartae]
MIKPVSKALSHLVMALAAIAFAVPLLWLLSSSLKPESQIIEVPPNWIPRTFTLENFDKVLTTFPFMQWFVNSVVVAVISTAVVLLLSSMAAYALARFRFRGRDALLAVIVSMLLVPIQVTIVPLFILFSDWGELNTYTALVLPTAANVTGVFLLRQFFLSIPRELEEAARIDGASDLRIWWSIIMPLAKPALAAVAALTFVSSWNNFMWPLVATSSDAVKTLPVGIAQFMSATSGASGSAPAYGPPLAAAVMATLPALIAFIALQRFFVAGVTSSGVKG